MKEIALKEKELLKLKKYPLKNIISTESYIYYYKKDKEFNNILLKKFHRTDQDIIERKERTIETIQKSNLKDYDELVIPKDIVTISGIKSGFTIKEVTNNTNLHIYLNDKKIKSEEKLEILKKIGLLLKKTQHQNQEFYFSDLQDYNFLVDNNKKIYAVDLDSSAVRTDKTIACKYIILDDKTRGLKKYKTNSSGEVYPNHEVDNYCFNTMVLNFLSTTPINRLSFEEYSSYLDYLLETNMISNNIYNILINQYTNKYTESIIDHFDEINKNTGRASYKVYKLYKEKIHN